MHGEGMDSFAYHPISLIDSRSFGAWPWIREEISCAPLGGESTGRKVEKKKGKERGDKPRWNKRKKRPRKEKKMCPKGDDTTLTQRKDSVFFCSLGTEDGDEGGGGMRIPTSENEAARQDEREDTLTGYVDTLLVLPFHSLSLAPSPPFSDSFAVPAVPLPVPVPLLLSLSPSAIFFLRAGMADGWLAGLETAMSGPLGGKG